MKMSFRWYGAGDSITLEKIRQIPNMYSVVTAIYNVPVGKTWSIEQILALKRQVEASGLHFDVIESVPVHEDIKLGLKTRDKYIEAYNKTIENLAKAGVKVVCYNFMPIFDWTRTTLEKKFSDGSTSLAYNQTELDGIDVFNDNVSLPGWDTSYEKKNLCRLFDMYKSIDDETLWSNITYFLKAIIPVAEKNKIKMAIHPDDPPWNIFGLPRIIKNEKNIDRFLKINESEYNGLTFCTGSLGANPKNNIPEMAAKYAKMNRIHFMHLRNVKYDGKGNFYESGHLSASGSLDMVAIMKALYDAHFDGYIRPDHGRMIWGETGRPGYGLYDRALGAAYINGIWETLSKL
jgi:mannonate dehydratase